MYFMNAFQFRSQTVLLLSLLAVLILSAAFVSSAVLAPEADDKDSKALKENSSAQGSSWYDFSNYNLFGWGKKPLIEDKEQVNKEKDLQDTSQDKQTDKSQNDDEGEQVLVGIALTTETSRQEHPDKSQNDDEGEQVPVDIGLTPETPREKKPHTEDKEVNKKKDPQDPPRDDFDEGKGQNDDEGKQVLVDIALTPEPSRQEQEDKDGDKGKYGDKKDGLLKMSWKALKHYPKTSFFGSAGLAGLSYYLYNKYYASGTQLPTAPGGTWNGVPTRSPVGSYGKPFEKSQSSGSTIWWIVAGVVVIAVLVGGFIVFNVSGDNQANLMQDGHDEMERDDRRRHHRRARGHKKRHKKQRKAHR